MSPQFLAKQPRKLDLTKRFEVTAAFVHELVSKDSTARKIAERIIQGVERGDFALCDDSLDSRLLFANMTGLSPKQGFGLYRLRIGNCDWYFCSAHSAA